MLWFVRTFCIALLVGPLLWVALRPKDARVFFGRYFLAERGPLNLALFRIWLFFLLASRMWALDVDAIAAVPGALQVPPPGWQTIAQTVPLFSAKLGASARILGVLSACLACLGFRVRVFGPIATVAATYLLGLPNFLGKISHPGHIAVLCGFVVSASRCADALSIDALLANRRTGKLCPSLRGQLAVGYSLPLRICWLLFGVLYFFPGFFKAWIVGDQWVNGAQIVHKTARSVIADPTFNPIFELYNYPSLAAIAGIGTLVFEIGFVYLLFFDRLRWMAPAMGAGFHIGVKYLMRISFTEMLAVYPCFIEFEKLLSNLPLSSGVREHLGCVAPPLGEGDKRAQGTVQGAPMSAPAVQPPRLLPVALVGGCLIFLNILAGAARVHSWPISVFPLFANRLTVEDPRGPKQGKLSTRYELVVKSRGKQGRVPPSKFPEPVRGSQFNILLKRINNAEGLDRERLLEGTIHMLMRAGYDLGPGDTVSLYKTRRGLGSSGKRELTRRELIVRHEL